MAYFFSLILLFLSSSAFAFAPNYQTYTYRAASSPKLPTLQAAVDYTLALTSSNYQCSSPTTTPQSCQFIASDSFGTGDTASQWVYSYSKSTNALLGGFNLSLVRFPQSLSCPVNSSGTTDCVCNSGYQENATHTACEEIPSNCPKSQSASATIGLGWFPFNTTTGTLSSSFSVMQGAPKSICVQNGAYKCEAQGGVGSVGAQSSQLNNGSVPVVGYFSGTLTGIECSGPVTPATVTAAPPPCAGEQGTVNGVSVCLPTETAAEKEARAQNVAAQAAAAAAQKVSNAGGTSAEIAAAGKAAGEAAASAIRAGVPASTAISVGIVAGDKAASTVREGGSSAAASSAASSTAAAEAAKQAVTAAGGTSAQADAAAAAAAAAAAKVLAAGGSADAAAAAGKAAGDAAAASAAGGASGPAAAASGAAAGDAAQAAAAAASAAKSANPLTQFCVENPASPLCKKATDGTFSGTCAAPPTCTGDAVQCAAAMAAFKTECLLNKTLTPDDAAVSTANAAKSGADGQDAASLKTNAPTVSLTSLDTTGRGWSRSCPADPSIPLSFVSGGSLTIPFSKVCGPLELLSLGAVALTMLASLVFVIGFKS